MSLDETTMRILVVEDDAKIASFVVKGLKQNGFAVDRCADGEEAELLARRCDSVEREKAEQLRIAHEVN